MSGVFSHVIERSVTMEATPWTIWKVLTDLAEYGAWNALYPEASGELRPGANVRVAMRFMRSVPVAMTMTVMKAEHSKELVWTCSYAFPGFLDIMHCFIIAPVDRYGSRFTHGIRINGILLPLFAKAVDSVAGVNMDRMTASLKAVAEAYREHR